MDLFLYVCIYIYTYIYICNIYIYIYNQANQLKIYIAFTCEKLKNKISYFLIIIYS